MGDHNDNILTDQPTAVSSGSNAKHVALGIGIAILVLAVVGSIVFAAFTLVKRKGGAKYSSRRYNGSSRRNNANYTSRHQTQALPSLETRMMTPTTSSSLPKQKTWDSVSSTSLEELVKKPDAVKSKGSDLNV